MKKPENWPKPPTDLKRDGFSPKEIVKILEGELFTGEITAENNEQEDRNWAIQRCITLFDDLDRELDDYSAMAWSPSRNEMWHVGTMPPQYIKD